MRSQKLRTYYGLILTRVCGYLQSLFSKHKLIIMLPRLVSIANATSFLNWYASFWNYVQISSDVFFYTVFFSCFLVFVFLHFPGISPFQKKFFRLTSCDNKSNKRVAYRFEKSLLGRHNAQACKRFHEFLYVWILFRNSRHWSESIRSLTSFADLARITEFCQTESRKNHF